jgi:hypothetical protein
MLSTAKERSQLIWRAVESNYFPQLRGVFYKTVRCGKCILSAANRGFQRGRARVKVASKQLTEAVLPGWQHQIKSLVPYQTLFTKDCLEF